MTIKQQGGIFGRNPTFNDLTVEGEFSASGTITLPADSVSGDAISGGNALLDTLGIGTASAVVNDLDLSGGNSGTPQIMTMAQGNATNKISTIKGQYDGVNEQGVIITSNYYGALSESTFTSNGYLTIQKGLRLANSGYGIDFSGVNTAAEILDDYEEGTWTPAYTASSGGAATYNTQNGSYTKIGNKVTVIGELQAKRNTLSGNITVSGLPFSHSGNGGGMFVTFAINFATDMPNLRGYATGTTLSLRKQATDSAGSTNVTQADLSDSATNHNYIYFTAIYLTA
jgi:hypothetical protein